ncbi:MAG: multidrug effflux MFS transporter [Geovibrio sp.]|nr:multidrug effflux MFS transporter [Geovibrio sp.]
MRVMIDINRHKGLYIIFLAMIGATPPLATDMYLAAIPIIAREWNVGEHLVNLSLVLWFASFSSSLLFYGPLSDKFGRRPVLLGGLFMFVLSSVLCILSANVWQLILFRILQGAGAAAPSAMVMAICRDKYEGEERRKAFAYLGTVLAVAPMVAPMIGAFLLSLGSWRYIFLTQASMVACTFAVSFLFQETIQERFSGEWYRVFFRYRNVFSNWKFMRTNLTLGISAGPLYAFIAFSPIYYIGINGFSESKFSFLFAFNAFGAMFGAFVCSRMLKYFKPNTLITFCLGGAVFAAGGLWLLSFSAWYFFTCFTFLTTFFICMNRPLSNNLIVEQVNTDIGSASSFMVFTQLMFGALCMFIVSGTHAHRLAVFNLLFASVAVFVMINWIFLRKRLS